ncbi:hypothetical protein AB0383_20090 [Amycolatopsis sp. NPDC051373]|uniref:hypothetical protein n=1 Tax=Amycolatopsis sp. NPDC051373 TaxID=3155801 RepID=UPI00345097E9
MIGKRIADALLAVQFDVSTLPPGANVDATGSRRRVQALASRGWSLPQIAARLGVDPTSLRVHQPNRRFIQKRNADAIKAVYDELWDQDPPTGTTQELRVARYAKTWARKSGFMPPGAWDDDTIDDPDAQPDIGEKVRANANAREEIVWLRSFGKTNEQIALHMGKTPDYIRAQLREAA